MPEEGNDDRDAALRLPAFEQIVLPTKVSQEVHWAKELPALIAAMGENPSTYLPAMMQFDRMRRDMASAPATPAGIDMAITYFRQLESLSQRVPPGEQAIESEFVWHNAFDHHISIGQTSMAFEKANVLFNIGALLSQAASSAETARNYQASASTLRYIADSFSHAPLKDIHPAAVKFLASLMLAQAQEAVVLKASVDLKGEATIAKLAAAASSQYEDACKRLESAELADLRSCLLSGVANGSDRDAYSLVRTKNALWKSISSYYDAFVAYNKKHAGDAVARMQQCQDFTTAALGSNEFADDSVCVRFLKNMLEHADDRLPDWQKENALIYGQLVPSQESLSRSNAAMLVKIVPLEEAWRFVSHRPDAFKGLMPLSAHADLSLYSEEKSKLLRYETTKATAADTELQTLLTSLGFPASLEKLMSEIETDSLPEEIQRLRLKSNDTLADPNSVAVKIRQTLDAAVSALDDEISEAQRLRLEYGADCGISPSHEGNAELYQAVATCDNRLSDLQSKITTVNDLGADVKTILAILDAPESQIKMLIPGIFAPRGDQVASQAKTIRATLDAIEDLAKERSAALSTLRKMILDDAPDCAFVAAAKSSNFENLLATFDEPCSRIEKSATKQAQLVSQFRKEWETLLIASRTESVETARKRFINDAENALEARNQCKMSLNALTKDALALLKNAESVKQQIISYCNRRGQERRAIIARRGEAEAASKNAYLLSKLQSLSVSSDIQKPSINAVNAHASHGSNSTSDRHLTETNSFQGNPSEASPENQSLLD